MNFENKDTPAVTRTVYSLYWPETRRIVEELWAERPHHLYEQNYTKRQDVMHEACLSGWVEWATAAGVQLGDGFKHHYPTNGASEGIHALMAQQASVADRGRVFRFDGEYEGYEHIARALGLPTITCSRDRDMWSGLAEDLAWDDTFWISQPSAIDGNLWLDLDDFLDFLDEESPNTKVVVDLTYVGAVPRRTPINLDRPNVAAVLWSLSKPFGVYYHRIGGLLSREKMPTLESNKWFKNLFSLELGARLMRAFPAGSLPDRYVSYQRLTVKQAIEAGQVPVEARCSDVVLLAHTLPVDLDAWLERNDKRVAEYRRGEGYRFCLTPAMDRAINTTEAAAAATRLP